MCGQFYLPFEIQSAAPDIFTAITFISLSNLSLIRISNISSFTKCCCVKQHDLIVSSNSLDLAERKILDSLNVSNSSREPLAGTNLCCI